MTELEFATLRVIAESADTAARLAHLGDADGAKSALTRAQHRLVEFTAGKPWHTRVVRLAREAVACAELLVEGPVCERGRLARATRRAAARAKSP